jgi:hypothetical protein
MDVDEEPRWIEVLGVFLTIIKDLRRCIWLWRNLFIVIPRKKVAECTLARDIGSGVYHLQFPFVWAPIFSKRK